MRTTGNNLALIFFALVKILLASLLDGIVAFVLVAAVTAFITWLAGAASPRDWALQVGAVCSGLVWFIEVLVAMVLWAQGVVDALRKERVERVLKEP